MSSKDLYCRKCGKVNPEAEDEKVVIDEYTNKTSLIALGGFGMSCFALLLNLMSHGWILLSLAGIVASIYGYNQCLTIGCKGKNFALAGIILGFISFVFCCMVMFFWW